MIALLQRVLEARVCVAGAVVGQIGPGLLLLVCAERGDTELQAFKLVAKVLKLRIFADAAQVRHHPPLFRPIHVLKAASDQAFRCD